MSLDKVMRKLAKLKKLYESAKVCSQGEAEAAARAINRLLTEYNLTMDEIGSFEEKEANSVMHEEISGFTYKSIGGNWEHRLTYVICKWNFCRCYTYGSSYKRVIIVGERQNIETVKWLVDMLKERFVAFSKDRYKEYLKSLQSWDKPMSKDKFQRSYLLGCAQGLDIKLREDHEREKKEEQELAARINALVVRKDAAVVKYVEEQWGRVKTSRGRKENYDEARATGYKDGKNTNINKPIAGGRNVAASVKMLN